MMVIFNNKTGEIVHEGRLIDSNITLDEWLELCKDKEPYMDEDAHDLVYTIDGKEYFYNDLDIKNVTTTSEAQKRAQKKYDETNKDKFRMVHLKLNRDTDAEIVAKLESVDSIQGYIKELIRADIR